MLDFNTQLLNEVKKRFRSDMPQISNHSKFTSDLKESGISTKKESVSSDSLKPTQKDFNPEKVASIKADKAYNNKALIVTKDNKILDGHHRWKAALEDEADIPVFRIDLNFDDLYDFVCDKDYVKYKEIHEALDFNSALSCYGTNSTNMPVKAYDGKTFKDMLAKAQNKKDLKEDEGGNLPNGVAGVENPDVPLGAKPYRRKKQEK